MIEIMCINAHLLPGRFTLYFIVSPRRMRLDVATKLACVVPDLALGRIKGIAQSHINIFRWVACMLSIPIGLTRGWVANYLLRV